MAVRTAKLSLAQARRIALAAQGFDRSRPAGRVNAGHVTRAIRRMGLLQIDSVNVLVRAHYMVLFSRLGPYSMDLLPEVVYRRGGFTEQWAHEASILPVESWPLLRHRMRAHTSRLQRYEAYLGKHPEYIGWVLEQVRQRGPLTPEALEVPEGMPRKVPDAWGSIPKSVLELYFARGDLAVTHRQGNFARVYDLVERVLPESVTEREPSADEARCELMEKSARAHGVGTAADLADYYRMPMGNARKAIAELLRVGTLIEAHVAGWKDPAYLHADARVPRRIDACSLLSPFDPVVWFRPRTERLFDFEYRIEIYAPKAKRRWGYYVLPFLLGDRIVARVDLKADRKASCLQVLAAYLEPGAERQSTAGALYQELETLRHWLQLATIEIHSQGNLATDLARSA